MNALSRSSVLTRAFAQLDDVDMERQWLIARRAQLEAWVRANSQNPAHLGRLQLSLKEMTEITQQLVQLDWMVVDTSVESTEVHECYLAQAVA
jgi:1-aminocyclopropane-1-carboxylate deaminase/D-cysteine desulfhydrase-like pyridoxal-dependent ACC family enzyme